MASDKCTPNEEKFILGLLQGLDRQEAYRKAYPSKKNWENRRIVTAAAKLWMKERVKVRYEILLKEFQEKEKEKTGWTREQSVKTLRFLIDKNMEEVERIHTAFDDELDHLSVLMKHNPDKAEYFIREMIKTRKSRRLSSIHNDGITKAVSELNKMHGYNEHNVNMNETVIFSGEDDLED